MQTSSSAGVGFNVLTLLAQAVDTQMDGFAAVEEDLGFLTLADARRGAGRNDVTRLQ